MKLLKLVPDNTNIDFMRWRKFAIILTMTLSTIGFVITGVRGLNLGIDFVGGQVVQANFQEPVDIEDQPRVAAAPELRGAPLAAPAE